MPECPVCHANVQNFLRKKYSKTVHCPSCKAEVSVKEYPELKAYVITVDRLPWEKEAEAPEPEPEAEEEVAEEEAPQPPPKPAKPARDVQRVELFEAPKEPHEVVAEILLDYGCSEPFVKTITRYIERKGYLDPQWLFSILLSARTGRKFTESEAFLVVDEIVSAIEAERRKAEVSGKPYIFTVMPFYTKHPAYQYPGGAVIGQPPPQVGQPQVYPQLYQPVPLGYQPAQPQLQQGVFPQQPSGPVITHQQPQLPSLADIAKMIREEMARMLEDKRRADELAELKKKIESEIPKQIEDKINKVQQDLMSTLKDTVDDLKSLISTLAARPEEKRDEVSKKDLELMQERIAREMVSRIAEAERKVLEERLESIKKLVESKSQPIQIPPSEGYSSDGARLIADTIKTVVAPGQWYPGRAVSEIVVKLAPAQLPTPPPERREAPQSGKPITELIKESGGEVE